jgi:hypothetical protein
MTIDISNNNPRISYTVAEGVTQTSFAVPFEFFDDSDLDVYVDGNLKSITGDYTVAGGDGSTGTVTISVTGASGGSTVIIIRNITIERTTDFTAGADINRAALNTQLDTLTAISADLKAKFAQTIRIEDGEEDKDLLLPDPTARADKLLKFDSDGNIEAADPSVVVGGAAITANFVNNTFTGDGSRTAFTTTVAAGSKNNTQVYIDGVYQLKSSYSVSGTTLTFGTAPSLDSEIEVIIGNAIDTADSDSSNINYNQGDTGAQTRTVESKLQDFVSVKDFGAVGDGSTDNTLALSNAQASGKLLFVPESSSAYSLPSTLANTTAAYLPSPTLSWENFTSDGNLQWSRGFTTDGTNGANIWRFKDRVFVGEAADYTGNRFNENGYGNSWTISKGSNYYVKNSTLAVAAPELDETGQRRYGILGMSKSMGVCAVAVNDGVDTFARGLYAEGFHQITGTESTAGIEVQMGNYTTNFPVANAYSMAGVQTIGVNIGSESGYNYEIGPDDDPITPPTQPNGCAIDVAGGSVAASYQRWVVGMVIRNGSLYRDPTTNIATAISLARDHEIIWGTGTSEPRVGFIRSTATSDQTPGGILLQNRGIAVVGYNEQLIFEARDSRANTDDAVNYFRVENSATGDPVDISAQGTDTDIDLRLEPKGDGNIRFGIYTGTAGSITGYITIKDAAGITRKLAVIS